MFLWRSLKPTAIVSAAAALTRTRPPAPPQAKPAPPAKVELPVAKG